MIRDPIVEEVRKVREAHAAAHGYDLTRIMADLRAREKADPRPKVSLPPKRITAKTARKTG